MHGSYLQQCEKMSTHTSVQQSCEPQLTEIMRERERETCTLLAYKRMRDLVRERVGVESRAGLHRE